MVHSAASAVTTVAGACSHASATVVVGTMVDEPPGHAVAPYLWLRYFVLA